jgi:hypothetical protein
MKQVILKDWMMMIYFCLEVLILIFSTTFWVRREYVGHLEVGLDDLLGGGPVVHEEEGEVEGAFGSDGRALLDRDACIRGPSPSEFSTMYSTAPSTSVMAFNTSSITMSCAIGC